ncbi:MAG TPA: saccharopine dehydrogenase NADP-binding domain-containing protein [bacterium]|nr:saccharopine dehydrogenase NADP-binding domain-containing protein [bacterium]
MEGGRSKAPARAALRVALFGFGRVGRRMAALLARRDGVEVVAVISRSLAGQPARRHVPGLPAGIAIAVDAVRALADARPDVVLHATVPVLDGALPQIVEAARARAHVISTCEELAYPWVVHRDAAETLDREARAAGVSVLGTGVNPGFVFDALVLEALSSRSHPSVITVSRVTDASEFGPAVRDRLGLGLAPAAFEQRILSGGIAGHIGFRESMDMIAASLGTEVQSFEESIKPLIADRAEDGLVKGTAAGLVQQAVGTCAGGLRFDFRLSLHLLPQLLGLEVLDSVRIEDGGTTHEIRVRPASPPVETAAAQVVNAIPQILAAEPGLRTRLDLRVPTPWVALPRTMG